MNALRLTQFNILDLHFLSETLVDMQLLLRGNLLNNQMQYNLILL